MAQEYFQKVNYRGAKLSGEGYFVFTFTAFLGKYECQKMFNGNKMYTTKTYESHGMWGGSLFDAIYELTDYAVVYHKLYYFAQLQWLEYFGDPTNHDTVAYKSLQNTKKVIDTRQIEVSNW